MEALAGKVAVVTGAGRGIGRATVLCLARRGARVVVNDRGCDLEGHGSDPAVADAVAREIGAAAGHAVADHEDAGARGAAERLVALALERFGRLDTVVACAGIARERKLQSLSDEDLDACLGVHVRGSVALTRAASAAMTKAGAGGSITLLASPAAFFGGVRLSAGAAAAGAIVAFARCAAAELRRHGVRVNAVAPTARTRSTEHLPTFQSIKPGAMEPESVAEAIAFLASDLAADVSGEVLGVAGGRLYALRNRETTGAYLDAAALGPDAILAAWADITRS